MFRREQEEWQEATGAPTLTVLKDQDQANAVFGQLIYRSLETTHRDMGGIRLLMRTTYVLLLLLYVAMFLVGIGLIVFAFTRQPDPTAFGTAELTMAGLGGADLLALGLLQPAQRIKQLMGDMAQLSILMNDHQHQALLRLIQMDKTDRKTIGDAATAIQEATKVTVDLMERYFTDATIANRAARRQVERTRRSVDDAVALIGGIVPTVDPKVRKTLEEVQGELARALERPGLLRRSVAH